MTTMRCTPLLIASTLVAGCLGPYEARNEAPRSVSVSVFGTPGTDVLAGEAGGGSMADWGGEIGLIDRRDISAHLEGRIHDVTLANDTTDNNGYLDTWGDGDGYLNLDVAALGDGGAGMILLGLPGGVRHPVFETGYWSSSSEADGAWAGNAALDPSSPEWETPAQSAGETWVGSCAGPSLGEFPYEQTADTFEMTAEEDPNQPGIVVLIVRSTFAAPGGGSSEVTATVRLRSMAELEARQLGS